MQKLILLCLPFLLTACGQAGIISEIDSEQVRFAITELDAALPPEGGPRVTIRLAADVAPEGYRITASDGEVIIEGGAAAGAMYGGLEVAEQLRLYGPNGVTATSHEPHLDLRGVKFNIPLDLRTPSYTDASDAAQKNIPTVWEMDFWTEYLDRLARLRYNYVSLWSLHPFPSLVKVPGFEDVALADVQRSTADWNENYHLHATGLDAPELLADPEIVKQLTIEEKIAFWREVMAYAKTRNIHFYFITWNIFTNGTQGKYGITDAIDNERTKAYFRESVTECFRTYPDLAGIGLTTGENMHRQPFEAKENWAYDTYAEGVLAAAREMPDRKFTFIHRQHQTGALDIAEKFKPLIDHPNINFLFCFKYAKAHAMSATTQHYHQGFVEDIKGMKTIWGLRNDSNYHFRWGAPDYVREFVGNLPTDVAAGIYYGSDQWVQGREFLTKDPALAGRLELDKHWFHWLLWGRLSYDPTLSNDRLAALLTDRFPGVDGPALMAAWEAASMVFPTITGFHWGPVDFKWYPEACKSRPGPANNATGFHDVNRFITLEAHPRAGFQSIPDYLEGKMPEGAGDEAPLSPMEVAGRLLDQAATAEAGSSGIESGNNKELAATLTDIRTMAALGRYYAFKIMGATALASYRKTGKKAEQSAAVSNLQQATEEWKTYVRLANDQYHNPLWTNRVGYVDWAQITAWVEEDVAIVKEG